MTRLATDCIVVRRTAFREADKVIVLISRDFGRFTAIAKGVRKIKSRLASGLEPLSVNRVEFARGRGEMVTIIGSRTIIRYPQLMKDYQKANTIGGLIRELNQLIEDNVGPEYFSLIAGMMEAFATSNYPSEYIETWFRLRLLVLLGRQPDLLNDHQGKKLSATSKYHFNAQEGNLVMAEEGPFGADQIKAWRVLETAETLSTAGKIKGIQKATIDTIGPLRDFMASTAF
jgi:DNA repair protein RecO (recombination protein O)